MTIGENGVDEVVRAIRAIQDINTKNSDRVLYTQAIELLKEGSTSLSVPTAFALASNTDKSVAHVGWNIIEHVVKYKWLDLNPDTRLQIRNGALEYISNGNSLMTPAYAHLRTALSRVVVSIIEHEWPQRWPDMFNQFSLIVAEPNYTSQCQMVFLILKRLVEDCYTLITVEDSKRRKDLQNAINGHSGEMIVMIVQRIRLCINMGSNNEEAVLLAKSAIELFSEVFEWVSGKVLAESIDGVIEVLCAYLQVETCGIYEASAHCLHKLAMRKRFKNDELPIIISMFRDQTMEAILTACTLAASSSNTSEEHYKFLKLLCDLLCALGIHLSEVWTHLTKPPDTFTLYLNALTEFFTHPSLYIRLETSQVLLVFSSNTAVNRSPIMLEKMQKILESLPKSMEKIGWLDDTNTVTSQYSQMDYDSLPEFLQEYTKLRDRCSRLISENMSSHFTVLSTIVTNWINGPFVQQTNAITSSEWDSMKRFITAYLQAANQLEMINQEVEQWLVSLMKTVFDHFLVITNPVVVNEMLSILSAFFVVLKFEPNLIPPILELLKRLLSTMEIKSGNQLLNNDSHEIIGLKRHCINLLLKLVTTFSTVIREYVQIILDVVVTVAPLVSAMQKANLVQILAALSNLDGIDNQKAFLNAALQDVIAFFESDEFKMCLTTQGLLSYIGAVDNTPMSEDEARASPYYLNRVKLKSQLSSIEGALSQVNVPEDRSNPLFNMCLPVIRNIFQFVTCLNSVYGDHMMTYLNPAYRNGLFTLSSAERQTIIYSSNSGGLNVEEATNSKSIQNDSISHMRRFFLDVGDMVQNIVGYTGSRLYYDFYSLNDSQKLIESVFTNADHLPDFRLRFWIKRAWSPIISNCPANKANVVAPITASLCRHLCALLTARWNTIKSFDEDGEVTEEELFSQQMVCILSREYSAFLSQLIIKSSPLIKEDMRKQPSETLTPLATELLKDRTVLEPLIASSCMLINCPDTKTVGRIIPVARQIIAASYASFDTEMATNLLIHGIRSLQVNGSDETCVGPLLGLNFLIYSLLRPIHPALFNILEQVPKLQEDVRREFDEKIVNSGYNRDNFGEKNKRDLMRKVLRSMIAAKVGEEFKRPVPLQRKTPSATTV